MFHAPNVAVQANENVKAAEPNVFSPTVFLNVTDEFVAQVLETTKWENEVPSLNSVIDSCFFMTDIVVNEQHVWKSLPQTPAGADTQRVMMLWRHGSRGGAG